MKSTLALREGAAELLAADPDTLAPVADANKMVLLKAPINPGENVPFIDLVPADFDGSTPLDCGLGTQPSGLDPTTSDSIITLKSPAGGWRWESTGLTNLPQTVYGAALMNNAMDGYYGAMVLDTPVTIANTNQVIDLGPQTFRLLAGSLQ